VLAAAALVLLAVGVAAPGLWRLVGVAGVALLAVFLPYRFGREQRRFDQRLAATRVDVVKRARTELDRARTELDRRITTVGGAADSAAGKVKSELSGFSSEVDSLRQEIAALQANSNEVAACLGEIQAALKPSRRFTTKSLPSARLELSLSEETSRLQTPPSS
jgi:hypothetical protein